MEILGLARRKVHSTRVETNKKLKRERRGNGAYTEVGPAGHIRTSSGGG